MAVAGLPFLLPAMTATAELALGPLVVTLVTALNVWYAVKALTSDDLTLVPLALLEPGLVALCIAHKPVRALVAEIPELVAEVLTGLKGLVDSLPRVTLAPDDA